MKNLVYIFTILWIGSQSATAFPYDVVNDWKQVDYAFNSTEDRQSWLNSSNFIPINNVIAGVKVSGNRMFLTVPRWRRGVPSSLNYIQYDSSAPGTISDAKLIPYPSWELNEKGNCSAIQYAQSMEIDPYGRMWVVDVGRINIFEDVPDNTCPPKLVIIDLSTNEVNQTHEFPQEVVSRNSSFLSDIAVGCENQTNCWAYLSENGDAKVIVYNLTDDTSWFARHESMEAQANSTVIVQIEGRNFTIPNGNINGIALSPKNSSTNSTSFELLYYSPTSSYSLYSINTTILQATLSSDVFGVDLRIANNLGFKPSQSDGMIMDASGTLYYGLLRNDSIAMWDTTEGQLTDQNQLEIIQDDVQMQWVDTFAIDESGDAFATTNRLQRFYPRLYDPSEVNFRVFRISIGQQSYQYSTITVSSVVDAATSIISSEVDPGTS